MKSYHGLREQLIRQIQEEFSRSYPFLRIEFLKQQAGALPSTNGEGPPTEESLRDDAGNLLKKDIQLSDTMKVSELETSLHQLFGVKAQILRKSGNFWMEIRMSREWTLKEQNDHGKDITLSF